MCEEMYALLWFPGLYFRFNGNFANVNGIHQCFHFEAALTKGDCRRMKNGAWLSHWHPFYQNHPILQARLPGPFNLWKCLWYIASNWGRRADVTLMLPRQVLKFASDQHDTGPSVGAILALTSGPVLSDLGEQGQMLVTTNYQPNYQHDRPYTGCHLKTNIIIYLPIFAEVENIRIVEKRACIKEGCVSKKFINIWRDFYEEL